MVIDNQTPEVVINAEAIESHTLFNARDHIIKQAAEYLREDIITLAKETPDLKWPITIEELNEDRRQPPPSVISFLECLLKSKDHPNRERVFRLITSYSADMINGVTRGKFVTSKHFLLGLGLHNITGQKKPVKIVNHLGHCIDYDLVCEVETAQAEKAQALASKCQILSLMPAEENETVLTYFWVDNFDKNIETQTGHGAINSTHMIAFQEKSSVAIVPKNRLEFERTRRRRLTTHQEEPVELHIDGKKEPATTDPPIQERDQFSLNPFIVSILSWLIIRRCNSSDQTVSSYAGWLTQIRESSLTEPLQKTV